MTNETTVLPDVRAGTFRPNVTAPAEIRERAVSFPSGEETLRGVLTLPRSPGLRGVVILHGWGTCRSGPHDMLVKLARELATLGLPALRFDFRGRGESSGNVQDTDLDMMIDAAARAAEFLREETGVCDVAAVGLCSGGNVALAAAALKQKHDADTAKESRASLQGCPKARPDSSAAPQGPSGLCFEAAVERAFDRVAALSVLPFQSHAQRGGGLRRRWMMLVALVAKALHPASWWRLVTGRVRVGRVAGNLFGGGGKAKAAANGSGKTRNLKDSRRDVMGALARFEGDVLFVWGGADAEGMGAKRHFEESARGWPGGAAFKVVEGASHNFHSLAWEREVIDAAAAVLRDASGA